MTSELHALVGGFLAGDNAFRSLANFGAVSRDLRQATLPILYETLVLDAAGDDDWAYGTRVDAVTGLVLPSGWAYVKSVYTTPLETRPNAYILCRHLFLSGKHHDRIKTIIWAAQKPIDAFLDIAFPQLKFHMSYQMLSTSGTSNGSLEWSRVCKLVLHRTVDTRVLHGILTSLPLCCLQAEADGKQNRITEIKAFRNGSTSIVREQSHPVNAKSQIPELTRLGLVSGITGIHLLQGGRLVNRMRIEPPQRYVQELDTDLTLRFDFTQDDAAVQATLYEVSMMLKRPSGMSLRDTKIILRCSFVSTQVYHVLIPAVSLMPCTFSFAYPVPSYAASFLTPYIICISPCCFRPKTL